MEVERVTPLLKVKLQNDNKDWRMHLQQMEHQHSKIKGGIAVTDQLTNLYNEIEITLEKISSREKYINSQFESQVKRRILTE